MSFIKECLLINKKMILKYNSNESNDNKIFEELISLMHIFSTKMYSNRRKNKLIYIKMTSKILFLNNYLKIYQYCLLYNDY
jgi:predicted site-specific integrase-resolvase